MARTWPVTSGRSSRRAGRPNSPASSGVEARGPRPSRSPTLAEDLGYDSILVYDHFHNVPVPAHESVFECWTTLALSQVTFRVRLGQMVGCAAYRNPGLLAKITSNIDVMSGGRLDWGIGAGWYEHEFTGYGVPFPPPRDRIRSCGRRSRSCGRCGPSPDVLRRRVLHARRRAVRPQAAAVAAPADPGRGSGEQLTLRVVARLADRADSVVTPTSSATSATCSAATATRSARRRRHREDVGAGVLVRETEAEVRAIGGSTFGEPFDSWQAGNLVGTPEQVIERIGVYRAGRDQLHALVLRLPGHRHAAALRRAGRPGAPLTRTVRVLRHGG